MPVQSTPPAAAAQCDLAALIDPLAQHFFGEPNARLSSKHELRFGTHGSLIVHLKKGTWYNHEAQTGGGAIDLVKLLMRWLEAEGWRHKQTSRPERDPERDNLPFADRIRRASVPIAGTSGAAYLVARGIALDAVPEGGGLRVHPRCPWQSDTAPCIVARFTDTISREPLASIAAAPIAKPTLGASLAGLREPRGGQHFPTTTTRERKAMSNKIITELVETNFLTRWQCHICGGETERLQILCEGVDPTTGRKVRVCEACLKRGNIDARLEQSAQWFEQIADRVRGMIGRVIVPTYAEWAARTALDEIEFVRGYTNDALFDGRSVKEHEMGSYAGLSGFRKGMPGSLRELWGFIDGERDQGRVPADTVFNVTAEDSAMFVAAPPVGKMLFNTVPKCPEAGPGGPQPRGGPPRHRNGR